jgi:photosystem II stability/assembly factor-like uncharacterized protein
MYAAVFAGPGTSASIYRSDDHGDNWAYISTNTFEPSSIYGFLGDFELDLDDPATMYISFENVGSGIYKSTDEGRTWSFKDSGIESSVRGVSNILIDWSDHNRIYAGLLDGHVVRSSDKGESWSKLNSGLTLGQNLVSFQQAADVPSRLFLLSNTGDITRQRIFKSENRGNTWKEVRTPYGVQDFSIDPRDSRKIVALCEPGQNCGLIRSVDEGLTWEVLNAPDITTYARGSQAVYFHPTIPNHIFLAGFDDVLRSTDGGTTWRMINAGINTTNVYRIRYNPSQPQQALALTASGGGHQVFRSGSNWEHWSRFFRKRGFGEIRDAAINPHSPNIYVIAGGFGTLISTDRGIHWRLSSFPTSSTAFDPGDDQVIYDAAGKSTDLGRTWSLYRFTAHYRARNITILKSGGPHFLGSDSDGLIIYSDLDGKVWRKVRQGPRFSLVYAFVPDPQHPAIVYAPCDEGVLKSTNAGSNWSLVSKSVTPALSLAIHPTVPGLFYSTDGAKIYISQDNMATWTAFDSSGLPTDRLPTDGTFINQVLIDPLDSSRLYAATDHGIYHYIH